MKTATLYARVSTSNHHQDPEGQLKDLRRYCERQGWRVVEEFVDRMSGAKDSRPALNRLMAAAREKRFEVVLVWKYDRFARSVLHLARALEEFRRLGIGFVSLTEQVDTTTPAGELFYNMLASFAQFERAIISERIKMGLRNARAKGKRLGRLPGFRKEIPGLDLADVRRRRKQGESLAAIAKSLGTNHVMILRRLRGK